jgi:hypothetical protein
MRCTIPMLDLLASVLEGAGQSAANQIIVCLKNILFVVAKDIGKMRHHKWM